ncbi:MAG: DUF4382 domain-containing protein [Bacteroidota bacterium]
MKTLPISFLVLVVSLLFISCSKNDTHNSHTVNVRLTDNPYDAEEVNVDIRSVQLKHSDDEGDEDGWTSIDTDDRIYNLLELQNDVNVLLASGQYPHDDIKEIRLLLGDDNSIKINGISYPMKVPSGSSSGLKIKVDKDLSGPVTDILIDFDAALSVHKSDDGQYMLRPVIRLK